MQKEMKDLARTQYHDKDWGAKGDAKITDDHTTSLKKIVNRTDTTKELSTHVDMGCRDSLNCSNGIQTAADA